jgi:hypothetical protein
MFFLSTGQKIKSGERFPTHALAYREIHPHRRACMGAMGGLISFVLY